jgi:hypothetical protein
MSLLVLLSNQTPPAPLQGITFFWIKDNGNWRLCTSYRNELGSYVYAKPYLNVEGSWT